MGVYEKEGICEAVTDYEENYLEFEDENWPLCIAETVGVAAGVPAPRNNPYRYFWFPTLPIYDGAIEKYRQESGRQYPPVYRIKLRIEAEALSDEETEAYWKQRAENAR